MTVKYHYQGREEDKEKNPAKDIYLKDKDNGFPVFYQRTAGKKETQALVNWFEKQNR